MNIDEEIERRRKQRQIEKNLELKTEGASEEVDLTKIENKPVSPQGQQNNQQIPSQGQQYNQQVPPQGQQYNQQMPLQGQQYNQQIPPQGQQYNQQMPPQGQQYNQAPPNYPPYGYVPPKKRGSGCLITAIIVIVLIIAAGVTVYLVTHSQSYLNQRAENSVVNAIQGNGSFSDAAQDTTQAIGNYMQNN